MTWKEILQFDIGLWLGFSPRPEKPQRPGRRRRKPPRHWKGPIYVWVTRDQDLYQCTRQLAAIVKANAPLVPGIQMAGEDAVNRSLKDVFLVLEQDLDGGLSLSEAMRQRPRFFPKEFVDQIETAEETGHLCATLFRLSDQLHVEMRLRFPWSLLRHPYVALFMFGCAIGLGFLPMKVYPVFADMLGSLDVAVPKSLDVLMAISEHLLQIGTAIAFLFALPLLLRELSYLPGIGPILRRVGAWLIWLTPFIGTMVAKRDLAAASHALKNLLEAGVPLHEALATVSTHNMAHIRGQAFGRLARSVESGTPLREALDKEHVGFPQSFRSLVALGETSATLPRVLGELDTLYRVQVDRARKAMIKFYVPCLTFMLALVTLISALALIELNVAMVNAMLSDM